jgi:uncharacterized protein YqeY
MNTKDRLEQALKDAMRANNEPRKRTIRMALSAIKLAEVDKKQPLEEVAVLAILQKEVKSHQETISEAKRGGRQDMVASNEEDITILNEFLPQPLTPEALESLAREVITEVGAKSMADMGKVMKIFVPRLEGRATGNEASDIVRKLLQAK